MRFKTQIEFEREFGADWRSNCGKHNWFPNMDRYFGMETTHPLVKISGQFFGLKHKTRLPLSFGQARSTIVLTDKEKLLAEKKEAEAYVAKNFTQYGTGGNPYTFMYKPQNGSMAQYVFYTFVSPTGNCQLQCAGSFFTIFQLEKNILYVKAALKKLYTQLGVRKPLLLIDVKKQFKPQIEQLPTLLLNEYKSSNGSQMVLAIIDLRKL